MSFFGHDLGDGYRLGLRDVSTDAAMHRLTLANLDRLRHWEAWAQHAPTWEETEAYTRMNLRAYAEGSMIPCVLSAGADGRLRQPPGDALDGYR